jgi:hypothetical protein
MRGGKGAAEEQATVESPDAVVELDVLAIQNFRRIRPQLGRDEEIASLDLLDTDGAEPLAPVIRDGEIVCV